jgi:hypothetical protein
MENHYMVFEQEIIYPMEGLSWELMLPQLGVH